MSLLKKLRDALPRAYGGSAVAEARDARHSGELHKMNLMDKTIDSARSFFEYALKSTGNEQYRHIMQSCKDLSSFLDERVGTDLLAKDELLLQATKDWVVVHSGDPVAMLGACQNDEAVFDPALVRHAVQASEQFGFHDKNRLLVALTDRLIEPDTARVNPELTQALLDSLRGADVDRTVNQMIVENTVILRAEMGGSYGAAAAGSAQAHLHGAMQASLLEYAKTTHNLGVLSTLSTLNDKAIAKEVRFNVSRFLNVDSEVAQMVTARCDSVLQIPQAQRANESVNSPR